MARTSLTFDPKKQRAIPLWLLILAVLLIVARIVSSHYPVNETADADLVHWTEISQATVAAQRLHRPVFYEFSAAWCAPCRMLEHEVFMDPAFATRINGRFIPVRVIDTQREEGRNRPEVQALMDRYGVNAFPTIVIAAPDGSALNRVVGYPGLDKMAVLVDSVH
jgi:thiol:disulfide interchange protein